VSRNPVIAVAIILVAVVATAGIWIFALDDDEPGEVTNGNGDAVSLGEAIYNAQCAGCHSIDGSDGVGPTFEGLYGSEVEMDDGSIVTVDEDHLYEAITDPRATTRAGFPDVMPSFGNLDEEELDGLVSFIRSLD
jgi:mono/diheme cytochrome c family protein